MRGISHRRSTCACIMFVCENQRHKMRIFFQIILWMKTIHYPNKIRSHLVTIVPMTPFTPKSTSKLRSAL